MNSMYWHVDRLLTRKGDKINFFFGRQLTKGYECKFTMNHSIFCKVKFFSCEVEKKKIAWS